MDRIRSQNRCGAIGYRWANLDRDSICDRWPKMDLRIDIELQGGLLLVTASGNFTFDAALRLLKEVRDTAKEKETFHF
jgi:hypothetical protein